MMTGRVQCGRLAGYPSGSLAFGPAAFGPGGGGFEAGRIVAPAAAQLAA